VALVALLELVRELSDGRCSPQMDARVRVNRGRPAPLAATEVVPLAMEWIVLEIGRPAETMLGTT
jgi:hypothetical protein